MRTSISDRARSVDTLKGADRPNTAPAVTADERLFRSELARMLGELFETYDPAQDTPVLAQARRAVTEALEAGRAFPDLRAIGRRALAELDRLGR